MSMQFDLFTNRATVSSPVAPARSDRDGDVTVKAPPSRPEYLSPICSKCGSSKSHYPNAKRKQDRFCCRPCDNARRNEWRHNAGMHRDQCAKEKRAAHAAVHSALKTGRLTRCPCEICGATNSVQAHHDDYSKPLDVMWLCVTHHRERHRYLDSIQASPEWA